MIPSSLSSSRETQVDAEIQAAVARGSIPPRDFALQAKWRSLLLADPSNSALLAAAPGRAAIGASRLTLPHVTLGAPARRGLVSIEREDTPAIMARFNAIHDPVERGQFYVKEIRPRLNDPDQAGDVIEAADTYVTTLVVQRVLDLLKWQMPLLSRVTSDFSGEAANYGDAITTRYVGAATVGDYDTTNGYVHSNATTTDTPVTINAHKFVGQIYHANTIASTRRRLFEEQVEASYNALAKDLSDALLALIVVGTFTNTPHDVLSIDFDRASLLTLGWLMTEAKIPMSNRTCLLCPEYYGALAEDTTIVGNLVNVQAGDAISTGRLPKVHGFEILETPNLPSTGNLTGFGFNRSALLCATRLPGDYTVALPGLPPTALVRTVTNPEDGLSVMLVEYVDHQKGMASWRIAFMYGVAAGQSTAGTLIRSSAP